MLTSTWKPTATNQQSNKIKRRGGGGGGIFKYEKCPPFLFFFKGINLTLF